MDAWNFEIFRTAISAIDRPDSIEAELRFSDHYQRALASSGREYAESIAKAEALYVLLQLDFEGADYLRSHLR